MNKGIKGDLIADYAWLNKGRKYWNLWAGNPFYITCYKFDLNKYTREFIIDLAKTEQAKEKKRFVEINPDIKWLPLQEQKLPK